MKREEFLLDSIGKINDRHILKAKEKSKVRISKILVSAACLVLIIAIALFSVLPFEKTGEITGDTKNISVNASQIEALFPVTDGIKLYNEVRLEKGEELNIIKPLEAEYLPVYEFPNMVATEESFLSFVDKRTPLAESFDGVKVDKGALERKTSSYSDPIQYKISGYERDKYDLEFYSGGNLYSFSYATWSSVQGIEVQGKLVDVNINDTDETIKNKVASLVGYYSKMLNKEYKNIKIERNESYLRNIITLTLYGKEKDMLLKGYVPNQSYPYPLSSDFLILEFSGEKQSETLYFNRFYYRETVTEWDDYYKISGKSKMLSVSEAEELIDKGYVFGGHFCDLCMQDNPEVDFSNYEALGFEYIIGENGMCIPFYSFYKLLYSGENGKTYAKTYVPAIEVEGIAEYFTKQKTWHEQYYGD